MACPELLLPWVNISLPRSCSGLKRFWPNSAKVRKQETTRVKTVMSTLVVKDALHDGVYRIRSAGWREDLFPEACLLITDDENRQVIFLPIHLLP